MKTNFKIFGIVLAIVLIVIVVLVSGNKKSDNVKIGVISSITGLMAGGSNLGENFSNGVTLAFEQYQKTIKDPVVSIEIQDDGYDQKKGVSAYRKLLDIDRVNAIINLSSPTIDAISSDVIAKANLPVIQLGSQSNPSDDNILELYPNQYFAVNKIANLVDMAGYKKIVVASQQIEAYAKWVDGFTKAHSGETINEKIGPSAIDFRSMALKIVQHKPDALVIFMGSKEGAQLLKRLIELDADLPPLYFDIGLELGLMDYENVLGSLKPIEGATGLVVKNIVADSFVTDYKKRFASEPGPLAEYGYDCFNLLMSKYNKDGLKWVQNLKKADFDGASGKIQFDELGLRLPEFDVVKVQNQKLVVQP